tara:strand:+ start:198 stop:431 length:234 start_codon:yes stop_codon:yes gene_type:complete
MDNCPWCNNFKKKVWPSVKKIKNVEFEEINIKDNTELSKKYGFKTVPALVRINGSKHKLFKGGEKERTIKKIRKFLK